MNKGYYQCAGIWTVLGLTGMTVAAMGFHVPAQVIVFGIFVFCVVACAGIAYRDETHRDGFWFAIVLTGGLVAISATGKFLDVADVRLLAGMLVTMITCFFTMFAIYHDWRKQEEKRLNKINLQRLRDSSH